MRICTSKTIFLIALLLIISLSELNCQLKFSYDVINFGNERKVQVFDLSEIAKKYKLPVFPDFSDSIKNNSFFQICFCCYLKVDKDSLKCSEIKVYPLKGLYNSIPDSSQLWNAMTDSIVSCIKTWEFYGFKYSPPKQADTNALKFYADEYYEKNGNQSRPFNGKQEHLIILQYGVSGYRIPHALYFMEIGSQKSDGPWPDYDD